ncbi:MAG: FG-GAP repeat protein [Planctomycetes bacterium]|nr:FG-GAP repeat protein [Planctomycetota bacterium]
MKRMVPILIASAVLICNASAQLVGGKHGLHKTHTGTVGNAQFGSSACGPGDINGDGIPDYVIGAKSHTNTLASQGRITAYSGSSHSVLWTVDGESLGDWFGYAMVAMGDLDDDGFGDIVVSAPRVDNLFKIDSGRAYAISGATGSTIWTHTSAVSNRQFGTALGSGLDINSDGYQDLIAGMSSADDGGLIEAGKISVLDGKDGSFIGHIYATSSYAHFGTSVASAGDLNADGVDDIIVGVPDKSPSGITSAGRVTIISGNYLLTGSGSKYVGWIDGIWSNGQFGHSVCGLGDQDGDGVNEFAVGEPYADLSTTLVEAGFAYVYSGASLTKLATFISGGDHDHFGYTVAPAGDMNSDGVIDLLVGAPDRGTGGSALTFSIRELGWLNEWVGGYTFAKFGAVMTTIGDLDGNNTAEYMVCAPELTLPISKEGQARIYGIDPFLRLSKYTASLAGDTVEFYADFESTHVLDYYRFLFSWAGDGPDSSIGLLVPLTADSAFHKSVAGTFPPIFSNGTGQLGSGAKATATLSFASTLPIAPGTQLYCCVVAADRFTYSPQTSSIVQILTFN